MKKILLIRLIQLFVITFLMGIMAQYLWNGLYITKSSKMKAKMGKRYVLNKDTLLVVDWSYYKSNYTFSNGSVVSDELLDKLPEVK